MIPGWNAEGLIPPVSDGDPAGIDRSPYKVGLVAFVEHFATSADRCVILEGYMAHRAELHAMGMQEGFQWLDGSFTENIEMIERRTPRDIDVVTFTSAGDTFYDSLAPEQLRVLGLSLADRVFLKQHFKVDFYVQSLLDPPETVVEMSSYWYGMWSHRRSKQWKGFLRIDLDPAQDHAAQAALAAKKQELAHG